MFRPSFFKLNILRVCFCACFSFQQTGFAIPVQYSNLDYTPNLQSTLEHATTEGNLMGLMQAQNMINGLPNYFEQSALGQFANKAMTTIDNVENAVVGTVDTVVGTATTAISSATQAATNTLDGAIESATDTVGGWAEQGADYVGDLFSSDEEEVAGSGFVKPKKGTSDIMTKVNELNPIDRLTKREENKKICNDLKTPDGVKKCFYLDNDEKPGIMEVGDIHQHVTKAQFEGIANSYADAAAIINTTANFDDTESDLNDQDPKTVSETLTKRVESDILFNVIGASYFALDLSTLELNSLSIYSTINAIKADGGLE